MNVETIKTAIFKEGENLEDFVLQYAGNIENGDVLVVTSKIVALAERRTEEIKDLRTKDELIKRESDVAIPTMHTWLTIKDGDVMASAGIDASNADGKLILLPKDSFKSAANLRKDLMKELRIKKLGVIVTDSRVAPFKTGTTGISLGYAGIKAIRDYRGSKDIFGREMKVSTLNVVNSLAAAAVLVMGEGSEKKPIALIKGAPVEFVDRVRKDEAYISPEEDMYKPLFEHLNKKKK